MKAIRNLRLRVQQVFEVHREFADLVRRERKLLLMAGGAMFGEIGLLLLAVWPLRYLVDGLLLPASSGDEPASLFLVPDGYPTAHPVAFVIWVCSALLAITVVSTSFGYLRQVWSATAGQRMIARLRKRLYAHLQRLSLRFHRDSQHGDLIARITGDIPALRDVLSETVVDLIGRVVLAGATVVILFWIDPLLATVAVATLITVLSFSLLFGRRIARVARRQRKTEGLIAHTAGETLTAVAMVKAHGAEEALVDRFARQNRTATRRGVEGTRLQAALSRYVEVCFAIGIAVVLGVGVLRVFESGVMTAGVLLAFVSYVRSLHKPLRKLSRASGRIGKAAACGERILEIMSTEPDERDAPNAIEAPPLDGSISLKEVTFAHAPEVPVLHDLSLEIAAGQRVALVGQNGAGKTTLVHLLMRFYEPDAGVIAFDGRPATEYTISSLRKQTSLALQETYLFGSTVRENLVLAAPEADDDAMLGALAAVGASFVTDSEDGLDFMLTEGGKNLSGGERRKISLAAAVLRPSAILILDEPTTHIDARTRDDLLARFETLTKGRTTLTVTHDADLLPRMDRVIHLEAGQVVEAGTHAELTACSAGYRSLFRPDDAVPVADPSLHEWEE